MNSGTDDEEILAKELRALLGRMVESPRDVEVQVSPRRSMTVFRASVADHDLGKVIGRQGRTVRALRHMLEIRGEWDDRRYDLEIDEPSRRKGFS